MESIKNVSPLLMDRIRAEKKIRIQAEQFISYFSKIKNKKLNEAFRIWAKSKDFDKETERAIRYAVYVIVRQGRQIKNG